MSGQIKLNVEELETEDNYQNEFNIENFVLEFDYNTNPHYDTNDDTIMSNVINYEINFTLKQLKLICDYYGLTKEINSNRLNKENIIKRLVNFELDTKNEEIVKRRKTIWFYINELRNDKFVKKIGLTNFFLK
jgi:hypothetical protein